jgi:hypothetical protein
MVSKSVGVEVHGAYPSKIAKGETAASVVVLRLGQPPEALGRSQLTKLGDCTN